MNKTILMTMGALMSVALWSTPPPSTTTSLSLSPGGSVVQFGTATATATVLSGGVGVTTGSVSLYQAKANGLPSSCAAQTGNAMMQPPVSGTVDANGQVTFPLATDVLGTIGYIVKYTDPGNHGSSESGCLDLVVVPGPGIEGCAEGLNAIISTTFVTSPGFPLPGSSPTWNLVIAVRACKDLTNVSAQGGKNAWTGATFGAPSVGSVTLRKATGGKNEVSIWNIGSMTAGQTATLPVAVSGSIKPSTPCGTVLGLLGSWSAITTSTDYGTLKSDYTGTTTVTVGPDPCTI